MKLVNKKTGEIRNAVDIDMYTDSVYLHVTDSESNNKTIEYHSLAELLDEWEDYAPKEPLIKDEKIRKALRAWYDALPINRKEPTVLYSNATYWIGVSSISFGDYDSISNIKQGEYYTIAELCGEEK